MLPLVLYGAVVLCIALGMIAVSYLLGERHSQLATNEPYESGMLTTQPTRLPYAAHFYIVALFFVIFDLEAAFIFAWAVAARELGATGYFGFLFFVAILTILLVYEWRQGALDWAASKRRPFEPGGLMKRERELKS